MRRPLVIYDFATDPIWISLYVHEENLIFFSISVSVPGSVYVSVELTKQGGCIVGPVSYMCETWVTVYFVYKGGGG